MPLANPVAWRALVSALYAKPWVVYAKEPFSSPEHMLKYLAGYTHRVALSNHRLVRLEDDRVTFTWKDYADGCRRKEKTLEAVEFVRRFALHIVPKGMVRIRQYGLLAHRDRTERLALCRSLLTARGDAAACREPEPSPPPPGVDARRDDGPRSSPVEPKRSSSGTVLGVMAAWLSLVVTTAAQGASTPSADVVPAAVVAEERCPDCGVGRVRVTCRVNRPTRAKRDQVPILDSS